MRLISVVLGSASVRERESGSAALLAYGYNFFESVTVRRRAETVLKARVYKGGEQYVAAVPASDVQITVPHGQGQSISTRATLHRPLIAPLTTSTVIGELQVDLGGKTLARVALYPAVAVPAGGWWRRMIDTISLWF
jgi:D-alanyl-D-alanine carboxypeptidase (penicillin-binding protein 5/6)